MKTFEATGSCLCGNVKFKAKKASIHVGACHCDMCRKWSGGPYMAVDCGSEVEYEGAQHIAIYDTGDWAQRGFCKICGSNLFWRLKETQQHMLAAGQFDDQTQFVFDQQVFVDRNPGYYQFSNKTQDLTEKEIFDMYSPA